MLTRQAIPFTKFESVEKLLWADLQVRSALLGLLAGTFVGIVVTIILEF